MVRPSIKCRVCVDRLCNISTVGFIILIILMGINYR